MITWQIQYEREFAGKISVTMLALGVLQIITGFTDKQFHFRLWGCWISCLVLAANKNSHSLLIICELIINVLVESLWSNGDQHCVLVSNIISNSVYYVSYISSVICHLCIFNPQCILNFAFFINLYCVILPLIDWLYVITMTLLNSWVMVCCF